MSDEEMAKISSHFVGCVFTLLITHFDGQQLFNWQAVLLANACSWTVLLESF